MEIIHISHISPLKGMDTAVGEATLSKSFATNVHGAYYKWENKFAPIGGNSFVQSKHFLEGVCCIGKQGVNQA